MGLMNTLTLAMFTISVGIVLLAVGMKSSFPIAENGFPTIWSLILSWLRPPFLYLIINGIILTIAASSRFSEQNHSQTSNGLSEQFVSAEKAASLPQDIAVLSSPPAVAVYDRREESQDELKGVMVNDSKASSKTDTEDVTPETEGEEAFADPELAQNNASEEIISTNQLLQLEYPQMVTEKPLVSSRFGLRKPITSRTPEGASALRVARPKRQETVENTWRVITEGCHMQLPRHHHKKHDPLRSDAFKSRAKFDPSTYRIPREPSMGRDELNSRVEAFIKKFNEDMRLQRQQSLQQYMEMIHRSA